MITLFLAALAVTLLIFSVAIFGGFVWNLLKWFLVFTLVFVVAGLFLL